MTLTLAVRSEDLTVSPLMSVTVKATAVFEVAETFEMLFEVFYLLGGIGARLDDERQQVGSTLVVGLRRLDEDLTDEIEGEG